MIAIVLFALGILYPYSAIGVVSATAQQATIVLRKIQGFVELYDSLLPNINITGREPVVISKDKGVVRLKNGSKIESYSTASVVGERLKIIAVDEIWRIQEEVLKQNVLPCANYTREICVSKQFEDYNSKIISFTSASRKSNYFYKDFCKVYNDMISGNPKAFACALDYKSAIRVGISRPDFFEDQRKSLPESIFASEYGSFFQGDDENSVFPYDLTDRCRKLKKVEYAMPRGSTSEYYLAIDIATSAAKGSDNAVITILKTSTKDDGTILRQMVYMRSYNGFRLDELADEVRKAYVRFPNIKKVIYDARGLGDSFPAFFSEPYVDPDTEKEYPAWGLDGEPNYYSEPMLFAFKANVQLNQELVSYLRLAIEQNKLTMPIDSRLIDEVISDGSVGLRKEELAVYIEGDAAQAELSTIVGKASDASANIIYTTLRTNMHKDRYSSLAMCNWYCEIVERENKRIMQSRQRGDTVVGIVSKF